jgi:hypothetical protein
MTHSASSKQTGIPDHSRQPADAEFGISACGGRVPKTATQRKRATLAELTKSLSVMLSQGVYGVLKRQHDHSFGGPVQTGRCMPYWDDPEFWYPAPG